jgi:ABC-2 type transport system permease protein
MSPQVRSWAALSRAMWKGFSRDRASQFFYFLFPLMFLVIFGLLYGSGVGKVTIGATGHGEILDSLPKEVVELRHYDDFREATKAVEDGDIPAAVRQQGDRLELRFSAVDQVSAGTAQGIVDSVIGRANQEASGTPPRYRLDSRQVENTSFEPIQYLTSGILAWGVAMGAAFGASLNLVTWRKSQLLRRLRLSPVSSMSVVGARVGVSLGIALLQGALFIGVALTPPFGLQLNAACWMIIPLLLAGTLAFMSIGLLVGSLVKTEEAASGAVNLIVLPMAFLSGVFFDPSALPGWLQAASWVLPMKHMTAGLLDVMVRQGNLGSALGHLGVLVAFAAVLSLIAARFFSWEDS